MNPFRRCGTDLPLRFGLAVRRLGSRGPLLISALLALPVLLVYGALIDFVSGDVRLAVGVWVDYIQSHGYWAALKDPFHNYTAPYIYLLTLSAAFLDGFLSDLYIIKLTTIGGALWTASIVYFYAKYYGDHRVPPILAATSFMLVPTVVMNVAQWGQADMFYSGFLAVSLIFALKQRLALMVVFFGMAVSFKLQAVFYGPFLLFMLLHHRANLALLALIPLIYLAMNLGMLAAGRSLESVMLIYVEQGEAFRMLALSAPNPWWVLETGVSMIAPTFHEMDAIRRAAYFPLVVIGLAVSALVGLRLSLLGRRRLRFEDHHLVAIATLSMAIMPYILPKMHERYFVGAVVFSFLLMLMRPTLWPIFMCLEIGSSLAHFKFLHSMAYTMNVATLTVAFVGTTAGLFLLLDLVASVFAPGASGRWQQYVQAYGVCRGLRRVRAEGEA